MDPAAGRYLIYIAPVVLLLVGLEALWLRRRGPAPYPWRDSLASIAVFAGYKASQALTAALLGGLYFALWQHRLWTVALDTPWALGLLFIGIEFAYYWFHRTSHEVRWLWTSHAVRHSPQHLNLSAAYRLGWTGVISGAWIFFVPLILLGFHPTAVFGAVALNLLYQFWLHTRLIGRLPRWFEYVFNTPSHHRVHHAVNPDYLDRNYGGVLILFDRLFGTFAAERTDMPCRYGLVHPIDSRNPLRIVFTEWARLWRDVARARRARDVFGYLFGPPGWRPDGDGETSAPMRAESDPARS